MARPRSDIQPRILQAARHRFGEVGVDAASLRSVAKAAGTSVGMVYYYYPTKDDLFLAVVEDVYSRLLGDLTRAIEARAPFKQRVNALYRRLGSLVGDEPLVVRLVMVEAVVQSDRFKKLVESFERGHVALVQRLVGEGIALGLLRRDLHLVTLMSSVVALGTLPQLFVQMGLRYLPTLPKPAQEDFVAELTDVLLSGIGNPTNGSNGPCT